MEFIRLVFDCQETVVINNQFTMTQAFYIDWPKDADVLVDNLGEKFLINVNNNASKATIIQINPQHFIVQLPQIKQEEKELKIVFSATHYVNMKKYTVELANTGNETFFTIFSKQSEKFAIPLGVRVLSPQTSVERDKIILKDERIHLEYDPAKNTVVQNKKYWNNHTPLPFRFLQHIQNKEYEQAATLISFSTNPRALEKYFGEFEIILNNFLDDTSVLSVIPKPKSSGNHHKARNFRFTLEDGVIANIQ